MIHRTRIRKAIAVVPVIMFFAGAYSPGFSLEESDQESAESVFWNPEYAPLKATCTMGPVWDHDEWKDYLTRMVKKYFDVGLLTPRSEVKVAVDISADGIPTCNTKLIRGTDADAFYCEQAIWDCAPFTKIFRNFKAELTFTSEPSQSRKVSEMAAQGDRSIHIVPGSITEMFSGPTTQKQIVSSANLLKFNTTKLAPNELESFRSAWISFCNEHKGITQRDLDNEVSYLEQKHPQLFSNRKVSEEP